MNDNHTNEGLLKAWADEFETRGGMDRNRATTTASLAFAALDEYAGGNWSIGMSEEIECVLNDDGISDGLSRWDMFRRLQSNDGNTRTVHYRGLDVEILSEWAYRHATLHQDGTSASFSATGDSAGTVKVMRDLDQVIDYLRAEAEL